MDYDRLRELQEKFEENPRRYFAPLANEYRKGGQPKRAIEICRAQLANMPGHMSGQIVFGQALYEAGEFDEARQVFERALTLDPENLIAMRTLGDMSLQSGDTAQARKWYVRLLDADPKDTSVIALVSEIDASAEAVTPAPEVIPGVDTDAGDQPIPFIADDAGAAVGPAPTPELATSHPAPAPVEPPPPPPLGATIGRTTVAPPSAAAPPPSDAAHPPAAAPPAPPAPAASAPPEGLERHYPIETQAPAQPAADDFEAPLGAEGLTSSLPASHTGLTGKHARIPTPEAIEGVQSTAPDPEPVGTEGLKGKPVPFPLEGARGSRSDDEEALDTWTPPAAAEVHERGESPKEQQIFGGASPEPFVNETMAQLYLQQGYRQLALKVYYQLAASRPNDQALRDRIAEIEAADRAAHPEAPVGRGPEPSIESPTAPPPARSPSIETPTPSTGPESEEAPSFDRSPVDSPPTSPPSRQRISVESPDREEPRAEPEGIAARQPSIREFFATLGRRRPPRAAGAPAGRSSGGGSYGSSTGTSSQSASGMSASGAGGGSASMSAPNSASLDVAGAIGGPAASASLDAVFAGAQVNPADSRAASRLAGAFSGTPGASRTPPTPPMPTPRVNPRLPQAQESEEDVAKFRAWLDGLTGE